MNRKTVNATRSIVTWLNETIANESKNHLIYSTKSPWQLGEVRFDKKILLFYHLLPSPLKSRFGHPENVAWSREQFPRQPVAPRVVQLVKIIALHKGKLKNVASCFGVEKRSASYPIVTPLTASQAFISIPVLLFIGLITMHEKAGSYYQVA